MLPVKTCKECGEYLNDDDRRWCGKDTLYCRECVAEPVFRALREALRKTRER